MSLILRPFWKAYDAYIAWSVPPEHYKENFLDYFRAKSIATLLLMSVLLVSAVCVANLFGSTEFYRSSAHMLMTTMGYLVAFLLVRRYSVRLVALCLFLFLFCFTTYLSIAYGGFIFSFVRTFLLIPFASMLIGTDGIVFTALAQTILNEILYYFEQTSLVDFWNMTPPSERLSKIHNYTFYCYFVVTFTSYVHESQYLELIYRLQKANNHKTEFLCKTSHELRTPLSGIVGAIELLLAQKETLSLEQYNTIKIAEVCAQNLLGIINDILDISKLEAGKIKLNRDIVNIKQKIEDVLRIVSHLIGKKNIEYKTEFGPGVPPYIISDRLRLRQILTNLLSNAFKFTERGQVTVTVTLEAAQTFEEENRPRTPPDYIDSKNSSSLKNGAHQTLVKYDRYIKIAVTDTGTGIDPSINKDLFKAFRQVNTMTRGTGLGLAICKQLCKKMGGSIHYKSEGKGKGSCFYFFIPCIVPDPNEISQQIHSLSSYAAKKELLPSASFETTLLQLKPAHPTKDAETPRTDNNTKNITNTTLNQNTLQQISDATTSPQSSLSISEKSSTSPHNKTRRRVPSSETEGGAKDKEGGSSSSTATKRMKVLLVEDNQVNQVVIGRLLEKLSCQVVIANHGKEALDYLDNPRHAAYDLIFMDLQMPVLDGLATTKEIRRRNIQIPIVGLSAHAFAEHAMQAKAAGMNDFVEKPVKFASLQKIITRLTKEN
jgi:signal transduction histidine kinase/ActR/RegA family two-component response regulator